MAYTPEQIQQMMSSLGGQQQQPPIDFASIISALRAPKVPLHLDMSGQPIAPGSGTMNPFSNGFFKDTNHRIGTESARLGPGEFGATGVQAGLAPHQVNPLAMFAFPQGQIQPEAPWQMPQQVPNQLEGMINPNLPDNQKYQNANFWTAINRGPRMGFR